MSGDPSLRAADPHRRPALVLIASNGEWVGRSLESVLELNGYAVLRVESGRRALDVARRMSPDALVLDDSLGDLSGVDVCRALWEDPLFSHQTPVFITSPAPAAGRVRTAAYEAGAWEYCSQPLDVELLLLKLRTFLRARRELEEAQARSLIDPLTGLYSMYGLQRFAQQLGAQAIRRREAFACLAVMPTRPEQPAATTATGAESDESTRMNDTVAFMAELFRTQSRRSDVVGYVGQSRFAILAPSTDANGAELFVSRLRRALEDAPAPLAIGRASREIQAGYCAVKDFATAAVTPEELVRRAESALQRARQTKRATASFSLDDLNLS